MVANTLSDGIPFQLECRDSWWPWTPQDKAGGSSPSSGLQVRPAPVESAVGSSWPWHHNWNITLSKSETEGGLSAPAGKVQRVFFQGSAVSGLTALFHVPKSVGTKGCSNLRTCLCQLCPPGVHQHWTWIFSRVHFPWKGQFSYRNSLSSRLKDGEGTFLCCHPKVSVQLLLISHSSPWSQGRIQP